MVIAAALCACSGGNGTIHVTVGANPPLVGVSAFSVVVTSGGRASQPLKVPLPNAPLALPPAEDFSLILDPTHAGPAVVAVTALDAAGAPLGSVTGNAELQPGHVTDLTLSFGSGSPGGNDAGIGGTHPLVWTQQASGVTSELLAVWGASPTHVIVVGANQTVLYTTNGGMEWKPGFGVSDGLLTVWGFGRQEVYAGGVNGAIFRSTDAGASWTRLKSGTMATIASIKTEGEAVRALTLDGHLLTSVDHGEHWGDLETQGGVDTIALSVAPQRLFAAGVKGYVFSSTDGQTWSRYANPSEGKIRYLATIFRDGINSGSWFAGTDSALFYISDDGNVQLPLATPNDEFSGGWSIGKDVYLAGDLGIHHGTGDLAAWSVDVKYGGLNAVWGCEVGPTVFVVGHNGVIFAGR